MVCMNSEAKKEPLLPLVGLTSSSDGFCLRQSFGSFLNNLYRLKVKGINTYILLALKMFSIIDHELFKKRNEVPTFLIGLVDKGKSLASGRPLWHF